MSFDFDVHNYSGYVPEKLYPRGLCKMGSKMFHRWSNFRVQFQGHSKGFFHWYFGASNWDTAILILQKNLPRLPVRSRVISNLNQQGNPWEPWDLLKFSVVYWAPVLFLISLHE